MSHSPLQSPYYRNTIRGFTLIELLVVIAIIGILSSVILVALNTARNKGNDATIKTDLHSAQTEAEIFYSDNGNRYNTDGTTGVTAGSACPTTGNTMFANNGTILNAIAGAKTNGGGTALCYMATDGSAYAAQVQLKTSGYWCVDNDGYQGTSSAAMTSSWTRCQ